MLQIRFRLGLRLRARWESLQRSQTPKLDLWGPTQNVILIILTPQSKNSSREPVYRRVREVVSNSYRHSFYCCG